MAFLAKLDLEGLDGVRLIDFSYSFSRDIDASGRPSGMVRGGTIQMTIESTSKALVVQWMTLHSKPLANGTIKIMDDENEESSIKTIEFNKAYVVDYSENFSWQGGENLMESFTITAEEIKITGTGGGEGQHHNNWPVK